MREGTRMFLMTAVAALTVVSDVGHSAPGPGRDSFGFESYNGRSIAAERGFVRVPLRHAAPDGPAIEIAYVRLPATTAHPKAPIVFLDGGPGASGIRTGAARGFFETFDALRSVADVILLDQRGIGLSRPRLACPAVDEPPLDLFAIDRPTQVARARAASESCLARLRAEGIDPAAFNAMESADDLEDLRQALGVDRLSLLGFSYGTHLGLAALRRHGDHIERSVLIGIEGPNHTIKLPSSLDSSLARLSALAAKDPIGREVPDMSALLRRLLDRLDREPARVSLTDPRSGRTGTLAVNADGLRRILLQDLGDASDVPVFPAMLLGIERGDTELLAWFVRKRYLQARAGFPPLAVTVDAASGATAQRWERIEREAKTSLLAPRELVLRPVSEVWHPAELGDSFRAAITSDVPTLFMSGTLDANTPPIQAEEIARGFRHAVTLVVENAGHEDMLGQRDVGETLVRYFQGVDVSGQKLQRPRIRFLSIEEAKADRSRR